MPKQDEVIAHFNFSRKMQPKAYSSLITTSVYLHIAVDDDATPGRLFALSISGELPRDHS